MSITTQAPELATDPAAGDSLLQRIRTGEGGIDFVGRSKLWYWITVVLLVISLLAIAIRGFSLGLDFEGGTRITMPAEGLTVEQVEETFTDATGVTPEQAQIVGSGDSATLEITSEHLTEEQIQAARVAIYETYQVKDSSGEPSPDAVGDSSVSESWGGEITKRMVISMLLFFVLAFVYIALRLRREMAAAAMLALLVDGIVIAGFYALFGLEVSPATVIGLLTVLSFSIYDTVIVFDKVRENTAGLSQSRRQTYAEAANSAVNQTVMRSISTTVISALPILALLVVAVWMLGVGSLRDLAVIQMIGVIEGVFSSIFLATPVLVSIVSHRRDVKRHNRVVEAYRSGGDAAVDALNASDEAEGEKTTHRYRVRGPGDTESDSVRSAGGATWRPHRGQ